MLYSGTRTYWHRQSLVIQYVEGIIQVIEEMCREGPYQTLYLRHAPCMQSVQAEYQQCSTEYQARLRLVQQEGGQSSSQEVELLCCSFQSYLSCSQQVVNSTCGRDTAVFTANFLDRMAAPRQIYNCSEGHLVCGDCRPRVRRCAVCRGRYTGRATAMEQHLRALFQSGK